MLAVAIVSAETVRPLRWQVLRPGRPITAAHFPEDEAPTTWHFAALLPPEEVVGIASFFADPFPDLPAQKPYRLRGMATHPDYQRQKGIGRHLIEKSLAFLRAQGTDLIWCYARLSAVPFYVKMGFLWWEPAGTVDIAEIGPHQVYYYPLAKGEVAKGV